MARYNADLANNFGNLASRVLNMAVNYLRRGRRRRRARTARCGEQSAAAFEPLAARHRPSSTSPAGSARCGTSSGTTNSYIEDRPALGAAQGRRRRRGGRRARRLPRGAADRGAAGLAADPRRRRGAVAPPRPRRQPRRTSGSPRPRPGVRLPGGRPLEKGAAAVPPPRDRRDQPVPGSTPTATCSSTDRGPAPEESVARAVEAGVERMVCVGTDLATSREAVRLAAESPEVWATVGPPPPRRLEAGRASGTGWSNWPAPTGSSASARPASTSTTSTPSPTPRRRPSGPRSGWPHDRGLPLVIHSRDAWDDTFRVLDAEGVPAADGLPLLHRWARTRRAGRWTWAA